MSNASEIAYTYLRQRLISGYYGPRVQLKEGPIADELGISRTPVRMALKRLVDDGLVVSETNRGMFVAEWTDRDIEDVWSLRLLLEPHAATLAAQRASDDQIASLRELNAQMREVLQSDRQTRIAELQKINFNFHSLVIEASGSPRLRTVAMQTAGTPMLVGTYYVMDEGYIFRSLSHHEDIVTAISMRDPEAASKAMWVHLRVNIGTFFEARRAAPRLEPIEES
ncbi:GntR family transcriptional regulator [Agrobacterium rubi]|uniref:GntR family transcriptional regulator n=1 Tax=Agrobacterium rubi TaxID=28099 RepID=UPI001573E4D8|nr:GntR family transcriptional regulator [Agrobacterium rubi]NTF08917.1 GntR family transcriptional regulator [Agrobacterium rubi]NTF21188.1 GntR family transcriptional regulator [Agrobacterium rubi]NTF28045.1 GntR family transcriptional regulator [Agrobacterium rubi]